MILAKIWTNFVANSRFYSVVVITPDFENVDFLRGKCSGNPGSNVSLTAVDNIMHQHTDFRSRVGPSIISFFSPTVVTVNCEKRFSPLVRPQEATGGGNS